MSLIILLFYKTLKKIFKISKLTIKKYFSKCLRYWIIGLFIMMISNLIISIISGGKIAGNQEAINNLFDISPLYIYFASVIYAPIVEELIFLERLFVILFQINTYLLLYQDYYLVHFMLLEI